MLAFSNADNLNNGSVHINNLSGVAGGTITLYRTSGYGALIVAQNSDTVFGGTITGSTAISNEAQPNVYGGA